MTSGLAETPLFLSPTAGICITNGEGGQLHQHAAAQIAIGLEAPLQVRATEAEPFTAYRGVIIPPNSKHQIAGPGPLALMLWSEQTSVLARLQAYTSAATILPIETSILERSLPQLNAQCAVLQSCSDAWTLADNILHALFPASPPFKLDERITIVLDLLKTDAYATEPRPITQLAGAVYLSSSRLRHLFKQQIGVSLQRYIVWHRLMWAIRLLGSDATLTTVAHTAGFADSAHFTRVFRAAFGSSPTTVLKRSRSVQVILCDP